MQFQCVDEVGYPLADVFGLVRDDMTALVPYLPDVEEIVVESRRDEPGGIEIVNVWRGSPDAAPKVVRKFLNPELLSWKDHAFWPAEATRAEWRLEPKVGGSLFECTGTTTVREVGPETTAIEVRGDLRVYPERLPGVPKLLAGKLRSKIEGFVVEMLVPNMQTMARGVQGYFDDQRAGNQS